MANRAVDDLIRLVPPARVPANGGNAARFADVERLLGLRLPDDYKQLVCTYGDGVWQRFWFILNPFSHNRLINLLWHADNGRVAAERTARAEHPQGWPLAIYPEPGGILPWGITDNGGTFWWVTHGPPSRWRTLYDPDGRCPQTDRRTDLASGCSDVLLGSVSGADSAFERDFGRPFTFDRASVFVPSPREPGD